MPAKEALLRLFAEAPSDTSPFDLIDAVNELLFALSVPPAAADFGFALQAFRARCRARFLADENAMIEARHAALFDHAADHRRLEHYLDDLFVIVTEQEPSADQMRALVNTLRLLLTTHIVQHDLVGHAIVPPALAAAQASC